MRALKHLCFVWLLLAGFAYAQTPTATPAPAATTTPTPIKPPAPLRVAVDPHEPPFVYKSGEKLSGLEIELARGLGDALNRPVVFVETSMTDLIPALLDDKADIVMSGMAINRLRQVRTAFCSPYLRIGQLALCRRAELSIYVNNNNLQNVRGDIGVVTGSTGDMVVSAQFAFAGHTPFPTYAEAVQALLSKKVDLVLADYPVAIWECAENEASIGMVPNFLSQEDVAWAVRKDDDALRSAANAYLEQLRTSGKLALTIHKWIPDAATESIAPSSSPGSMPAPAVTADTAKPPAAKN